MDHFRYVLTDEALTYLKTGSPEAQLYYAIPNDGIALSDLKVKFLEFGSHKIIRR